jgi:formylmethanofuran dehydrogenase subunit A
MKRLAFLCLILVGTSRAQSSQTMLVLRGGTLINLVSGKEIPDTTVVIRGERIEEIGAEGSTTIPDGAQVVEARGKWIVPGLIDSHVHVDTPRDTPLTLYLANGVRFYSHRGQARHFSGRSICSSDRSSWRTTNLSSCCRLG